MLLNNITNLLALSVQQPPDIWHDSNVLALMGIGVGILGVLATVGATLYTVRQARTKRRIDYQIVSDTPIVTVNSTVAGKVQVLFNGQLAEKTRVLVLKISNIGNSSIHKEDYFEPLTFEFDTDVISADVLDTEPPMLLKSQERKNFLKLGSQNVQFPPFPLNPRDIITMTILLKEKSAMRVIGRLDQGTITDHNFSDIRYIGITAMLVLITLIAGAASIVLLLNIKSLLMISVIFPFIGTALIIIMLIIMYRMLKITKMPISGLRRF